MSTWLLLSGPSSSLLFLLTRVRAARCDFAREQILDKKRKKYLVRWAGFGEADDTWEPIENLGGALKHVQQYEEEQKQGAHCRALPLAGTLLQHQSDGAHEVLRAITLQDIH